MSNYLTLDSYSLLGQFERTAGWLNGRRVDWVADLLAQEAWPVQYKWGKQSTLRGRVLDLC